MPTSGLSILVPPSTFPFFNHTWSLLVPGDKGLFPRSEKTLLYLHFWTHLLADHTEKLEVRQRIRRSKFVKVFFINIQIVMGPTPPGTGVMCPATLMASSYSTSPHMRRPDFLEGSSLKFIPTSIMQAPGLIQSALTNSGCPIAAITMSACRTILGKSFVRE